MGPPPLEYSKRDYAGHRKAALSLSWSASGRRLASGGCDEQVRVWNVEAAPPGGGGKAEHRAELAILPNSASGGGGAVYRVGWHPKRDDQLALVTEKYLK
jgi:WD40 repeat protein